MLCAFLWLRISGCSAVKRASEPLRERNALRNMKKKICGIYAIYRIGNPDLCIYVGQSIDIEKRWCDHRNALNLNAHKNAYLQIIFNRVTEQGIRFEVVEECSQGKLTERERYYIADLKAICNFPENKHYFERMPKKKINVPVIFINEWSREGIRPMWNKHVYAAHKENHTIYRHDHRKAHKKTT